jgi:hypothetical protein
MILGKGMEKSNTDEIKPLSFPLDGKERKGGIDFPF